MAKVYELEGVDLDYWVAQADAVDAVMSDPYPNGSRCMVTFYGRGEDGRMNGRSYCPSTHWGDGGEIIERELISVYPSTDDKDKLAYWVAVDEKRPYGRGRRGWLGPTPLIAAMRAFVASKYGDETPERQGESDDNA